MNNEFPHRTRLDDGYDPRGVDGKGWNRIAILPIETTWRCVLKPKTRQAALDTLRGMAHYGVATAYDNCSSNNGCKSCIKTNCVKEPWNQNWIIREDNNGRVWLLGNKSKGWGSYGYCFKNWDHFLSSIDAPMLVKRLDNDGAYYESALKLLTP